MFSPGVLLRPYRMLHYYNCSQVQPRREMSLDKDVLLAPNVSIRSGARISLGDQVQIVVGARTTFGPDCQITAADYGVAAGQRITEQERPSATCQRGRLLPGCPPESSGCGASRPPYRTGHPAACSTIHLARSSRSRTRTPSARSFSPGCN